MFEINPVSGNWLKWRRLELYYNFKSTYNITEADLYWVLRNLPLWSALDSSALDSITLDKGKLKKLILRNHPLSSALGFKYDSRHLLRCLGWSTLHEGFVLESSVLEFHKIAFWSSTLDDQVCLIIKYTWILIKSVFFQVHFNHTVNIIFMIFPSYKEHLVH